jgi:hypothetical protein
MKRLALLLTLVAAVAGSVAISSALANDSHPIDQQTGFACGVYDAYGNIVITYQSSDTWFASGKEQLHCVGQGAGNGTVVYYNGFACGLIHSFSTDPNNVDRVSKSGESQLTCYGYAAPPAPPIASSRAGVVG